MRRAGILGLTVLFCGCAVLRPRSVIATNAEQQFESALAYEDAAASASDPKERQHDLDLALAGYSQVLRLAPNDPAAYGNRANVQKALGDSEAAVGDLDLAIRYGEGADRAFYLRRMGDLKQDPGYYWTALEWNPFDRTARDRVLAQLIKAPQKIQISNYFRYLIEYRDAPAVIASSAALIRSTDPEDSAAAAAAGLALAAVVVRPEEVEQMAAPFLARSGAAGDELRTAIRGESVSFDWIASHATVSRTTEKPAHAAYRALAHAVGKEAAARGDLDRARRQHRLATHMPGADRGDWQQLIEFELDFEPDRVQPVIEEAAKNFANDPKFDSLAAYIYALCLTCGDATYGVRHHVYRLIKAGVEAPPLARTACPDLPPLPDDCCSKLGVTDRRRQDTLLVVPPGTSDKERECALDLIALDYRSAIMSSLVIETSAQRADEAARSRKYLVERGIPERVIHVRTRGNSLRVRVE